MNAQLTAPAPIEKHAKDMGDKTIGAGATPFTRAARSADVELMKLLVDHGADPKLVGKDNQTALMVAAGVNWTDHIKGTEDEALEAVKLCVSLGLDVNAATDKGETALHGAAHRGADSIAKYLIGIVTEDLSARDVELVAAHADILQIGARNAQNFSLITEAARAALEVAFDGEPAGLSGGREFPGDPALDDGAGGLPDVVVWIDAAGDALDGAHRLLQQDEFRS